MHRSFGGKSEKEWEKGKEERKHGTDRNGIKLRKREEVSAKKSERETERHRLREKKKN